MFLKETCCHVDSEILKSNQCEKCVIDVVDVVPMLYINRMDKTAAWKNWRMVNNRMVLCNTEGSVRELLRELNAKLPAFKMHSYIKRSQQNYISASKMQVQSEELIKQVDNLLILVTRK